MRSINISEVKSVLDKILKKELSAEAASAWANELMMAGDERALEFIPEENEDILWESILFILGIDLKDSPDSYLYGDEDIVDFKRKIESLGL